MAAQIKELAPTIPVRVASRAGIKTLIKVSKSSPKPTKELRRLMSGKAHKK